MAMNQVQFQPGLSMSEFFERYGTEEKCEAALLASRWPSGWSCPNCGSNLRSIWHASDRASTLRW